MWISWFSAPQNAKKGHQLKHKNQEDNCSFIELGIRVWKIIIIIRGCAQKSQTFTLISIKIETIENLLFTRNRVFKHKEVVSIQHVCTNDLEKCDFHIYFTFLQELEQPHIGNNSIFFRRKM